MNSPFATVGFVCFLTLSAAAQAVAPQTPVQTSLTTPAAPSALPDLGPIMSDLQRATLLAGHDLAGLHIERWKTDPAQKQQMQHMAEALQRNLATIMPGPAKELQTTPGSVSRSFKLYNNLGVLYDVFSSMTDAAGSLGRPEEYDALAGDLASLDKVRKSLSHYTEQAAAVLESQLAQARVEEARLLAEVQSAAAQTAALRKSVFDDTAPARKPRKTAKKTAATASAQ